VNKERKKADKHKYYKVVKDSSNGILDIWLIVQDQGFDSLSAAKII